MLFRNSPWPVFALVLLAESAVPGSAREDDPAGRWEFFLEQRRSPGVLSWGARLQVARETVLRRMVLRLPPGTLRDGVSEVWEPLGPEIIDAYVASTGRVSAVTLHPADMDVVFAGGARGGVWRTDDGGETWTRLGESAFAGPMGGTTISRIVVDSATAGTLDATIVFAATARGLFRSTDSGVGWTEVLDGIVTDVIVHGGNRDVLLAMVSAGRKRTGHATLHRSADGGMTWQALDPELGILPWRAQLAQAPSDPDILYLSAGEDESVVMARSSDGGDSWTRVSARSVSCGQRWYNQALAVHPADPDIVYFGAVVLYRSLDGGETFSSIGFQDIHVDQHILSASGEIRISLYRGRSWKPASGSLPERYLSDLAVHPFDSAVAYAVFSGFGTPHVYVTHDYGASWADLTGDLPDHPVNAVLLDPSELSRVYIGTDLGVFTSRGDGRWSRFGDGLPMVAVFDLAVEPAAGVIVAATHGRGAFALPMSAPLALELRGAEPRHELGAGGDGAEGGAPVRIYGTGWPEARWSAQGIRRGVARARAGGRRLARLGAMEDRPRPTRGRRVRRYGGGDAGFGGCGFSEAVGDAAGPADGAGRARVDASSHRPLHRASGGCAGGRAGLHRGGHRGAGRRRCGVGGDARQRAVAESGRLGREGPRTDPLDPERGRAGGRSVPGHDPGPGRGSVRHFGGVRGLAPGGDGDHGGGVRAQGAGPLARRGGATRRGHARGGSRRLRCPHCQLDRGARRRALAGAGRGARGVGKSACAEPGAGRPRAGQLRRYDPGSGGGR